MSHDIFQADYTELERIAQQFIQAADSIDEMVQKLRRSRDNLEGEWIGLGSDAFFGDMDGDALPGSERLRDAFLEAGEVTRSISLTIRTAEEQAAALFQGDAQQQTDPPSGSQVPAAAAPTEPSPSGWDRFGGWVHGGLDVLGLVPGVGELADGANALIYLAEGDHLNAGLSAAAMIPIAGWGATGTKFAIRAGGDLARRSPVPDHVRRNALRQFRRTDFYAGGEQFSITRERMDHFLSRHHPEYWGGETLRMNTPLDPSMSIDDVNSTVQRVIQEGYSTRTSRPRSGTYEYTAVIDGVTYRARTEYGKVVHFTPVD